MYLGTVIPFARQHKLPLIDLPNSMDPFFTSFFTSQIEPSARGSELIARMIHHVIKTHDWNESRFFHAQPSKMEPVGQFEVKIHEIEHTPNIESHRWCVKDDFAARTFENLARWGNEFALAHSGSLSISHVIALAQLKSLGLANEAQGDEELLRVQA
jgi:hypothetical protein